MITPAQYPIPMLASSCPVCLGAAVFEDNYSSDCTHNTSAGLFSAPRSRRHTERKGRLMDLNFARLQTAQNDDGFCVLEKKEMDFFPPLTPNAARHVGMVEYQMKSVSHWKEGGKE